MNATNSLPTHRRLARTVAPTVAGALLLIGCSAGDSPDAGEAVAEAMSDAMTQLLSDFDPSAPMFEIVDPSEPPAERTPAAIPDGIYRGPIDTTGTPQMLDPEISPFVSVEHSEMIVEIDDGAIRSFSATVTTITDGAELSDGLTLCASDKVTTHVPALDDAWIDDTSFYLPTTETVSGTVDCNDGFVDTLVDEFQNDFGAFGTYVDGRIEVEVGFGTTATLTAHS